MPFSRLQRCIFDFSEIISVSTNTICRFRITEFPLLKFNTFLKTIRVPSRVPSSCFWLQPASSKQREQLRIVYLFLFQEEFLVHLRASFSEPLPWASSNLIFVLLLQASPLNLIFVLLQASSPNFSLELLFWALGISLELLHWSLLWASYREASRQVDLFEWNFRVPNDLSEC